MIHVESSLEPAPVASKLIERAAQAALKHQRGSGDVSVVLADDARLRDLNRQYLGIDAPTDVLSFASSEKDPDSGRSYLGDILISMQRAKAQALQAHTTLEAEVQLLVVHGVLHLLGHDHADAGEKARMWAAQREILQGLGLGESVVHE